MKVEYLAKFIISVINEEPKDKTKGKTSKEELKDFPVLHYSDKHKGFSQFFFIYNNPNSYFYIQYSQNDVIKALRNLKF